ncbi:MAG: hypothetical protein JNM84_20760 [Planctomycetes bacterium]|nr:hypothetical protein [Planctomycetota bacterium]
MDARALVGGLHRLARVGALYASDHPRFGAALYEWRPRLQRLCDAEGWLRIGFADEALHLAGATIELSDPEARRLHEIVAPLGIAEIAIARTASDAELQELLRFLAELARRAHQGQSLGSSAVPESFPASLRLRWREFGRRVNAALSAKRLRELLREAAGKLQEDGTPTDSERSQRAREALKEALLRSAEISPSAERPSAHHEERGLVDVLELCTSALRENLSELLRRDFHAEELQGALRATEIAAALAADEESMAILLEVLHEAWPDLGKKAGVSALRTFAPSEPERVADPDAVCRELESVIAGAPPLRSDELELRLETLSLHLHLLWVTGSQPSLRPAIEERLRASARPRLGAREFALIEAALRDAAKCGTSERLDAVLPTVLDVLRSAQPALPWKLLVQSLEVDRDPALHAALWPQLVRWLALEPPIAEAQLGERARILAARLPEPGRELAIERAAHLLESCAIAPECALLSPPARALFPVLQRLRTRDRSGSLANTLRRAFARSGQPTPIAEALTVLPSSSPLADRLLAALLAETQPEPSPALRRCAVQCLATLIERLPVSRREEGWVGSAIEALGAEATNEGAALLQRIRSEREHLIRHTWSNELRRRASLALQRLQRNAHG